MYLSFLVRKISMAIALVWGMCLLHACSSSMDESPVNRKSRVQVDVRAFQFDIENEDMRAASRSISDAASRLSFAVFDAKDALVGTAIHQQSADIGYGTVQLELYPGTYKLVAVAHNGEDDAAIASTTSVTLPGTTFTDTFAKVQELTVEADEDGSFIMQLPRVTSAFILRITDTPPANLKEMEVIVNSTGTVPGSLTMNPTDGLALGHWKQTRTIAVADISKDVPIYFIKQNAATVVNVKATAKDTAGNEIISHTINNVSLVPNQKTVATGCFFNSQASGTFTLDSAWDTDKNIEY